MEHVTREAQEAIDQFRKFVQPRPPRSPRNNSRGCMTTVLARVIMDLRYNWHSFPENWKEEVKRVFYVNDKNPKNVVISLLGPKDLPT